MGMWPLYRENLLQGPSHVSLAVPGVPSNISKSVGGTQPALLLFPNIDYLQSFIKGNVGIGDSVLKASYLSNLNQLSKNENAIKSFAKSTQLDFPDLNKYKKNGEIKIPASDIQLPTQYDSTGLKAMEKTIMTSIFETQKPYMDIAKVILSSMVKIEDIMARVMPILSVSPLTSKSEKPIVKDGSSNGTKSIGYQNGLEIQKIIAELEKLSKIGGKLTVNKDGTTTKDTSNKKQTSTDNPNISDAEAAKQGKEWRIVNTVYSTGAFDPSVDYLYTYNILPPDDEGTNNLTPDNTANDPDNPYDKYKPKKIILGIFKSDGTPLNPNETLQTISLNGISVGKADTPFKKADWLLKSPKWYFKQNEYIWPSFGGSSGEPIYLWEGPLGVTQESKKSPGNLWKIKKYKKGDKNQLNKVDAIEGDPIIVKFDASDTGEYSNYFKDYTTQKTKMATDLDQTEKDTIVSDIMSKLDVQSHLQNVFLYGSAKNSYYKDPSFPDPIKKSFKPYQIYVSEAANDPKLSGDGLIWVDPEADYEFKVIRVDPVSKIEYQNAKGEPNISSEIKSFVKNKVIFKLENDTKFNIVINKNTYKDVDLKGITEYTLDNWNYENGNVIQTNFFNVTITTENGDVIINKLYDAFNLPGFGKQQELTISLSGDIKSVETDIPLYGVKISSDNSENGIVIDPSKIKNDFLATPDLFSNGIYGNGTKESPQEIEIIKRYALTDLDTESYYIIEGVAVDDNKKTNGGQTNANASGDDGNKWYRLPHAIGAMIPFIKLLIDLATKLFPSINKLLKLFSNPMSFITDIISQKLGEAFSIFSPESFKKFEDSKKIIDKKKDIIDNGRTSDYSNQLQRNFNTSPLVQHVYVDKFSRSNPGKFKFLLDGTAMIPFEIFGKSLPFGMELKMANLIPEVPNINVPQVPKVNLPTTIPSNSSVTTPNITVPNVGIPSITLPKVQSPLKLILGKPGTAKTKDCDSTNINTPTSGQTNSDYLNSLNNPNADNNQSKRGQTNNLNDKFVTSTWYSTGQFIKGVDYNYFYVTQDTENLILQVDNLINPSGSSAENKLPGGSNANNSDNTTVPLEDLQLAKEKISNALKNDPTNPLLKLKLKEINEKLLESASNTQPILKLALGMIATPIKVISCVVQWIMDFFKSLINPMMLPSKIIEFISFKWILKFFSPDGLLKTAGINFNPSIVQEWVSLASKPNVNTPSVNAPNVNTPTTNIPSVPSTPNIPKENLGSSINNNTSDLLKNIKPHNGKYALPDNFELADLTKFLDVSFMATLPTYDAKTIRENPTLPFMIFDPVLCFIEKLINAFIDFVWSTLGIEAVVKPPHIKLCKSKTPDVINKLQNGEAPKVPSDLAPDNTTEIDSTMPYQEKKASDPFIYEVKLPDGKIITLKNDEELQNYLNNNKDLGYDFQF